MSWPLVRLGDVCNFIYGFPFNSRLFNADGRGSPLIRIRDVTRGFSETYTTETCDSIYNVQKGDLLIGMDGEFNLSLWKSKKALLNQRVCKLCAYPEQTSAQYLRYSLGKFLKDVENEKSYTTVKHLSAKDLNNIFIPLPPLPEQKRIVTELEKKMAATDKLIADYTAMADQSRALFRSTLSEAFASLKAPKVRLGEVCKIVHGRNYKEVEDPNGKYPIYGTGGKMGMARQYLCSAFSTLIGRKGTLDNPLFIKEPFWNIDTAFGLIPTVQLEPRYLFLYCRNTDFTKLVPSSGRPSTNGPAIAALTIPLPPLAEQHRLVAELDAAKAKAEAIEAKAREGLARAELLRKAILKEAFE